MSQQRKSIAALKAEYDLTRELHGKPFVHNKTGEDYQVLFCTFDEETNEKNAVYVLSAMPWLKFNRPFDEFLTKFTEGRSIETGDK